MQPVRVSVPGATPLLPLRMISAGAGDKVGLLLMVIAPSRMEAMGWPNGELRDDDLTYDYNAPSTDPGADFLRAFRVRNAASGADAIWLTQQGWQVTALDISATAIDRARAAAAEALHRLFRVRSVVVTSEGEALSASDPGIADADLEAARDLLPARPN